MSPEQTNPHDRFAEIKRLLEVHKRPNYDPSIAYPVGHESVRRFMETQQPDVASAEAIPADPTDTVDKPETA